MKNKKKSAQPSKVPVMREGKPASSAFETAMQQILNPLPKKKRAV